MSIAPLQSTPNPTSGAMPVATLVTCSFSGDLELCRLLCESVDRFVPDSIEHVLYVPAQDEPLFAEFATGRRSVRTQEALLPR